MLENTNERLPDKWVWRFLDLSEYVSEWSKDPSTKCGCVIVNPDKTIVSLGYNGFPAHEPDDHRLHNREEKYPLIVHAERNAIKNSNASLKGTHLFVTPFAPCEDCASVDIRNAGIAHVYTWAFDRSIDRAKRWKDSFDRSMKVFREAGIKYHEVDLIDGLVKEVQ